jgi:hypothetical protein
VLKAKQIDPKGNLSFEASPRGSPEVIPLSPPKVKLRVSQKDNFFFICSFGCAELVRLKPSSVLFVRPKRNEPKKKGAVNDNFSLFWQNASGVTLPKKAEVRAISGLPPHDPARNYC